MGSSQSSEVEEGSRRSQSIDTSLISRPAPLTPTLLMRQTTLGAPPPYSDVGQDIIVEEPGSIAPPPVPPRTSPRNEPRINRASASVPPRSTPTHPHRRTVSHSQATQRPSVPPAGASPADGVGGFRAQLSIPELGSSFTTVTISPPPTSDSREDALLLLKKYDTVIVVDDSASMAGPLWFEARNALAGVAEVAGKYDEDGIDVHFLNDRRVGMNLRTAREVERLFDRVAPDGITPTGEKLEELLLAYLLDLEKARDQADAGDPEPLRSIKPVNFIVLTDGAPTDDPESVIVAAARRLDARNFPISQVGIQFVQIGSDPAATQALQELDDDLAGQHGIRDMVDTTPYSGGEVNSQMLTKILLGGINRRVDKRGVV